VNDVINLLLVLVLMVLLLLVVVLPDTLACSSHPHRAV
jgi:hypothetical protein